MENTLSASDYDHAVYLLALSEHVKAIGIYNQTLRDGDISPADRAMLLDVTRHLLEDSGAQGFPLIAEHARILGKLLAAPEPLAHLILSEKLANLYEICNAAIELEEAQEKQDSQRNPVIVAVDDDPMMRLALTKLLEKEAQIFTGKNSHDALHLMRTHKPSLVLMDDIMPGGVTGLSLLEELRQDPELARIPVVMVTASCEKENVLRGLKAGAADYITKPLSAEKLLQVVRGILGRREKHVALYLSDKHMEREICDKLQALQCKVSAGFPSASDFVSFVQKGGALAVFDEELGDPNTLAQSLPLHGKALCLITGKPSQAGAAHEQRIHFFTEARTADAVVRAIGRLFSTSSVQR